ncbi:MAG TPA: multicopper oxidase domain-containing protein, partial [Microvirga sp.]|nr:multicopper oxidase domain-containing protein [Microvirga sp.]
MRDDPVQQSQSDQFTRRDVCKGFARISGALLGSALPFQAHAEADLRLAFSSLAHPSSQGEFYHPQPRPATRGVLDTTLRVAYARCQVGDKEAWLRCYDGEPVGPTLRLRVGETLKLRVENRLPVEPDHPSAPSGGHGAHRLNTTNIHFHGLHVSPQYNADNVLVQILPEGSHSSGTDRNIAVGQYEYAFTIPDNHPAGTFWYHAHHHGSTAVQVASMMAGAFIIEGDLDDIPEVKSAQEYIFLFQQIPFSKDEADGLYKIERLEDLEINWLTVRFTTINGVQNPTIRMKTGEVQRWRFINAGLFSPLSIQVIDTAGQPQVLHPIALDGIPLETITPQAAPLPTMGPGNRIDILFKAPGPGTYYLAKTDDRGFFRAGVNPREDPQILATVVVDEERREMPLPPAQSLRGLRRPGSLSELAASPFVERVEFDIRGNRYVVNGASFDPHMAPRTLILNNVQRWTVRAKGGDHPFHIHVNPFLLVERNGRPLATPEWRDTILVPNNERVTFLTRYEDFTGKFVLHCHNLGHEDRGMMELVEV